MAPLRSGTLSKAPDEAVERKARGLKYDNTNSDVDGSQQRSGDGECEARIDTGD